MSADVAAVLAEHFWDRYRFRCSCGWEPSSDVRTWDDTRAERYAHVAEALAPLIAAVKADAWDEGAARATPHGGAYLRSFYAENPYRDE